MATAALYTGYMPRGKKPRQYPPEIVALACRLYEAEGMTVREVQDALPPGYRAQTILERYLPERRKAAKRDQSGPKNHSWKGDEAGYQALHLRVESTRGKPKKCAFCQRTSGRFEWANMTGDYADVWDYIRLCVSCHRAYDAGRRAELGGERTSPVR